MIVASDLPLLAKIIPAARRHIPSKGKSKKERYLPEIKFSNVGDGTKERVLSSLASSPVDVYAMVIDKEGRTIADTPENLASLVARLVNYARGRPDPPTHLLIDRHFPSVSQRSAFDIRLEALLKRPVFIEHLDSQQHSIMCLPDFVAGAIRVSVARGDTRWYDILKEQIAGEEHVSWRRLRQQLK